MVFINVLLGVIALNGATGENLRARAYFDANNVKVGDPMVLTIDFLGKADFASLHPPALSKAVDRKVWKVDDLSAKTQTAKKTVSNFFNSWEVPLARTITYKVRPLKEGVLWFPELEFEYTVAASGETQDGREVKRIAKTSAIPVHVVMGEQVVVAEMGEDENALPQPDALVGASEEVRVMSEELRSDENWFKWKKACAHPTAEAFAQFDFPAAKMNEARCAILDGNWARAMKIYSRLEWRIGQTPAIERGIVAALAVKAQSREVELPIWRQVGRPLLRHAWPGRVGILFGGIALIAFVFWLLGRIIRALAIITLIVIFTPSSSLSSIVPLPLPTPTPLPLPTPTPCLAQGFFNFNFGGFGEMEKVKPAEVNVRVQTDRRELQVGDDFKFLVSLEAPKEVTLENLNLQPSETFGMQTVGKASFVGEEKSADGSNTVVKIAVPVRYDVPFNGLVTFTVEGMQTRVIRRKNFSSSSSTSFRSVSRPLRVEVRPLPSAGQPADFSGIVASKITYSETPDMTLVNSNDVIVISCVLMCDGYIPPDYAPPGVAYEWQRGQTSVEWKKYFVADGAAELPKTEISYYDPKGKVYKKIGTAKRSVRYK